MLDSIRRIVQTLRVESRAAERDAGISSAQLFVLTRLAAAETSLSVGELAERTLTHQSSVSVVVQKLESRGLVARTRSSEDGRRVELSLTPAARAMLRKSPETAQDRIVAAVAALPTTQRRQIARSLSLIAIKVAGDSSPSMFFEDSPVSRRVREKAR